MPSWLLLESVARLWLCSNWLLRVSRDVEVEVPQVLGTGRFATPPPDHRLWPATQAANIRSVGIMISYWIAYGTVSRDGVQ